MHGTGRELVDVGGRVVVKGGTVKVGVVVVNEETANSLGVGGRVGVGGVVEQKIVVGAD